MAMFGTTQGSFQPTEYHDPIIGKKPGGASAPSGERTTPVATQAIQPNSQPIK
jgi:hypothetical protein